MINTKDNGIDRIKYFDADNNRKNRKFILERYFEWNSYYRMLNGLPPAYTENDEIAYLHATGYGKEVYRDCGTGTLIIPALYERYFIDVLQYTLPEDVARTFSLSTRYLHELKQEELSVLESCGVMKQIQDDYGSDPHYQYIYHLGDKRVDYYTARTAGNYALLWVPKLNIFDIIEKKFRRVYERNRAYTMSTVYSEAYRFMSYNYDNFIEILIIIQTMVDMISEVQEYIINKDIFDSRTIRYLFESYGIAYYKEIPIKYQIRIIKNVNTLLKYKSSHRNITDILELFDDTTTIIYTYYLMKTKKLNRDEFFYYTEDDVNPKYDTNRKYWIGPSSDISNNKVPLMDVRYDLEDRNFIISHVYNYRIVPDEYGVQIDYYDNRSFTEELDPSIALPQPLIDNLSNRLKDEKNVYPANCFVDSFLRSINWFDILIYNEDNYNTPDNPIRYLHNRNAFLTELNKVLTISLSRYMNELREPYRRTAELRYQNMIKLYNDPSSLVKPVIDAFIRELGLQTEDYDYNRLDDKQKIILKNYFIQVYMKELESKQTETPFSVSMNRYDFKKIKYFLYTYLGIFDGDVVKSDEFDAMTDDQLEQFFYDSDALLTDKYRTLHGLDSKDEYGNYIQFPIGDSNCYMLNHTIPFMVYLEYKEYESTILDDEKEWMRQYSLFNNTSKFSSTPSMLFDRYDIYTKQFRRLYIAKVRGFIENIFMDLVSDPVENPTPRYIGWMDLNYVRSQLGKGISEFEIGDEVSTIDSQIPIYNTSYAYDIVTKDMIGQEFFRKNYNLCFLKTPILDPNAYKVLERFDMRRNYDVITLADPFWDGVTVFDILTDEERARLHESKKREILAKDFTIERTKYIGVEAAIDLTKKSYQLCYFMNMLFDSHLDEDEVRIDIDSDVHSDGRVRLNDILTFAIALNYMYQGVEPDNVASDMEKNMTINGFNFDTDWTDIYNYLQNQHHIYNNYSGKPDQTYEYTDEFGERHHVINGYGMNPMEKGWMSELYEDWQEYEWPAAYDREPEVQKMRIYMGIPSNTLNDQGDPDNIRYFKDSNGNIIDPSVGAFLSGRYDKCSEDCITSAKMKLDFGWSDIWYYNLCNAIYYEASTGVYSTIDIAWKPTQYLNDDNNSHGLWLDTELVRTMDETSSDLTRINMLKKIYTSNTNLYNHLTYMMRTAQSKRMYDIYKVVFDSYMETKMNHRYYKLTDNAGNPIFTDKNDKGSSYHITKREFYIKDNEGYPKFDLVNVSTGRYTRWHYVHNADFTECKYVKDEDSSIEVNCLVNDNFKYATPQGVPNYLIGKDYPLEFPKGYMYPENPNTPLDRDNDDVFMFIIAKNEYTVLQNDKEWDIFIPIESYNQQTGEINYKFGDIPEANLFLKQDPETGKIILEIEYEDKPRVYKEIDIEWKIAEDYYEFMRYRDIELYNHLIDLKYNYSNVWDPVNEVYKPSDEKRTRIEYLCELIVIALEKYFEKDEWRYIFDIIPTANIKNIQDWILKMIVFFKSWKTQIVDVGITYIVDDPYGNHVQILDDFYMSSVYTFLEKPEPREFKYFEVHTEYKDKVDLDIGEKVEFVTVDFPLYYVRFGFGEKLYGHKFDFPEFTSRVNYNDVVRPREKLEMHTVIYNGDVTEDANHNLLFP